MKPLFFLMASLTVFLCHSQTTIKGYVKAAKTNEPIPGAVIYFPDLKNGTTSKVNGAFEINNLPRVKTLVQVKLIGYKTIIRTISIEDTLVMDFLLEESVIEANEVVVTGVSKATEIKRNPVPMIFISSHILEENTATNIIDAMEKTPGINALTTGPNVSKPFIRGLGYNRILTLFDGMRQESQQWGDEHGIEIDQYLVDRIEVVKGPASLIYGSDALAGVVNLIPENPVPEGELRGAVQANYQSNNGLRGGSVNFSGNNKGFIYGLRTTYKEATNYRNAYDGRVFNTGFNELNAFAFVGLNRKWGYSHLNFSAYENNQEIPDGSRDSVSRKFTKQIDELDTDRPIVSDSELKSYSINAIHQSVLHQRVFSSSNFILGQSKLAVKIGFQKSWRAEFSHPEHITIPGLFLKMNTSTYDVKYYLPENIGLESVVGINGMYQKNDVGSGTEFVIPDYSLIDFAPFIFLKKNFNKIDVSGGARYDIRSFENSELYVTPDAVTGFDTKTKDSNGATQLFENYKHTYNGFSGSIGMTYNLSQSFLIKANFARGYRAPNISEISAKGIHPGTGYQQLGDLNLKPEFNLQGDIGLFIDREHVSASLELFNNRISNYIFNQKLLSVNGGDSIYTEGGNEYPVFKYIQTTANLIGGEARIDIHPHPVHWLHFENAISIVNATNLGGNGAVINDSNKYLPLIPPLHTISEIMMEFAKGIGCVEDVYVKIGVQYYAPQKRAFLENNTETHTPSYTLIDIGAGGAIKNKKKVTVLKFGVFVTNLADLSYQSHLNRMKYFDDYPVNGSGRSGIFNMGRNISFKITVPLNIKLNKSSENQTEELK